MSQNAGNRNHDLLRNRAAIAVCRLDNTSVRCECTERSADVCADMLAIVDTVLRVMAEKNDVRGSQ